MSALDDMNKIASLEQQLSAAKDKLLDAEASMSLAITPDVKLLSTFQLRARLNYINTMMKQSIKELEK